MKSKRGIYYDLSESNYEFTYKNMTFYFSSNLYMSKFMFGYKEYVEKEKKKLMSFYKTPIANDEDLMISYYKKIEKRGYRIDMR